jgi:Xaa-Pro aminopeptidase
MRLTLGTPSSFFLPLWRAEYVPDAYKRRAFLTGFTGSAGTAVVTADQALLWTDSRYWNEAGLQLSADWTLQKAGLPETLTIPKWLAERAKEKYEKEQTPLRKFGPNRTLTVPQSCF